MTCTRWLKNEIGRLSFLRRSVAYLSTSANIYAITRGHALLGIFIISEGIKLSRYPRGMTYTIPLFSAFLCLIFSAFDIPSFGFYNGAMSTNQTENVAANLRSIEFRLNFRMRRMPARC